MYIAGFVISNASPLPLRTQGLKLCAPPSGWDGDSDIHSK